MPIGSASPPHYCGHWWTRWRGTSWVATCCTLTILPSRCWRRAWAGPAPAGSGPTSATSARTGALSPPAVLYRYSPDRKAEHPKAHLQPFRGVLQADGYSGFEGLYEGGSVVEAACWAHVRRGFYDQHLTGQAPLATEALRRIGLLYAVEEEIRDQPPDLRASVRQAKARPVLEDLHAWFTATLGRISGRSDLAGAIRYALARWKALTRYVGDGRLEPDNNPVERAIRPIALGRKNWLFAGSDAGGHRAAAVASLVATARLSGLDPEAYLRDVLERTADHPINRIAELLPWNLGANSPVPQPD